MLTTTCVNERPLRMLSLGAGVQSTAVLLLSIDGHLPPITDAVFADTGWEPLDVYDHLARLEPVAAAAGIALHKVSAGDIRHDALNPEHRFVSMPLFVQGDPWTCEDCQATGTILNPTWQAGDDPDDSLIDCPRCGGSGGGDGRGMIRRQCTSEYKLKPIKEQARRLLGAPTRLVDGRERVGRVPGKPGERWIENWVGISTDEVGRIRPSDVQYMRRVDPLVDIVDMSRADCLVYLRDRWPFPVARSACIGCPFHDNREWREMRDRRPEEFAQAVQFDAQIRNGGAAAIRRGDRLLGQAFLHPERVPLSVANIDKPTRAELSERQPSLFGDEGCNPFSCTRESGPM
jgi:hypothetical protein